jgi:acyl-CoA reductase-like NAD-dependent aldehyde dehydrogenase
MIHIPILRKGRPYRSLDVMVTKHYRTREPFVEISRANVGLISRDLLDQETPRRALASLTSADLVGMCRRAAGAFETATLPLGDGTQGPDDYVKQVTATTGMPNALVRGNMTKIANVLRRVDEIIGGLTRGMDLSLLDRGLGEVNGVPVSFFPRGDSLGVVLPSNSPGVHGLWIPAIPLKIPLVLKPGSAEPWSPYRIAQALIRVGCPKEAFSYYPADHAGGAEILRSCGRGIVFGDIGSIQAWHNDPRIEVHGPGFSKVVIGPDRIDDWERYLDIIVRSVSDNGGRSCINASGVWVPKHADRIAKALAERLAAITPREESDDAALLAPFVDPAVAGRINQIIERGLAEPGARDVTAGHRGPDRLVERFGATYLLPTVVRCDTPVHPLANKEFLFPFASVVSVDTRDLLRAMGPTLVVTAITEDRKLIDALLGSPHVGRLNLGPTPTSVVQWNQPHEGNLFEHLYARRAFQVA